MRIGVANTDCTPLNTLVEAMIDKYTLGEEYKGPMMAELTSKLHAIGLVGEGLSRFLLDTLTAFAQERIAQKPSIGIDEISRDSIIVAVNQGVEAKRAEKSESIIR